MKRICYLLLLALTWAATAQAKFTYWSYADKNSEGAFGNMTSGKAAIYIPAEVAQMYKGLQLTGLRVGLERSADQLSVFATTDLNGTPLCTKAAERANLGNNIVKFDTPYTITGEPFYVGYEVKGDDPAVSVSAYYNANANWTNDGSGWVNNAAANAKTGKALLIAMRIEGDELPLETALVGVKDVATRANSPFHITGRLLNLSAEKIYNYRIGYRIGDGEEQFADFEETVGERSESDFDIAHDGVNNTTTMPLSVRIVSVNGKEDAYSANNAQEARLLFAYVGAQKRAVMEEYTGLYCGYCPRGIVGIQKCQERFGDRFIAIAKHCYSGTPQALESPTYDYIIDGGFPKSIIDRRYTTAPGPTTAPTYVAAAISGGCAAGIEVEAAFVEGSDSTQISARIKSQFTSAHKEANYRFALAMVEDSITGYKQANNFAGTSSDMGGFESLPSWASIVLNHVARMGVGVKNGIEGSVPSSVDEFTPIEYEAVLDVPDNVQHLNKLRVVAFLIDKSTGYIDNAAETDYVKGPVPTGISEVKNSLVPDIEVRDGKIVADGFDGKLQVYTVSGMAVKNESLAHGIYIVKMSNGKDSFTKRIAY